MIITIIMEIATQELVQQQRSDVLLFPEQFVAEEQKILTSALVREIILPPLPQDLMVAMRRAKEIGWIQAAAHFLPKIELKQNSEFPGLTVKLGDWYWQQIREGKIAKDAATLGGMWAIFDGSQKPQYDDGKQMYENDLFAPLLTQLREEG